MQPEFTHYIINDEKLFNSLVRYEKEVETDLVSYDLETNSAVERLALIYGIGLAFSEKKAFYIPWRNKDGSDVWTPEQQITIRNWLKDILTKRKVIGHNVIYDVLVTDYNFNFALDEHIYADTILMKHTLDEEKPFALKEIAPQILGPWATKAQEQLRDNVIANGGKWTEDQKDMYLADTNILGEYCCWDVLLTLMLFNHFNDKLKKEQLDKFFYEDEVMPLYKEVTINMKRRGFQIDLEYFKALKIELDQEIDRLENEIYTDIAPLVQTFEQELLDKKHPVKAGGNFPKVFAETYGIPLPVTKDGKITLAKKALDKQMENCTDLNALSFYTYCMEKLDPPKWIMEARKEVQKKLYFESNPEKNQIFNLSSGDHIGHLLFKCLGITPSKFTDAGKPSTDKEVLDELIEQYQAKEPWLSKLYDFRKLGKLQSTYVEGIIDRQVNGFIYTSMLQFGTTSGRYASQNPNLQNQPRIQKEDSDLSELVLKYTNSIKKGFVAGRGYKVVNADYASLEPRCFAHMSGDTKLQNVFSTGEDLYSLVGIETFDLQGVSANKKAANYLGDVMPEMRQKAKEFVLMVPYGAEEAQVSRKMGVSWQEAGEIINGYLNKFPNLRKYMNKCNYMAKNFGHVKTELGRVRHLKEARSIYILYGEKILDPRWAKQNNQKDNRSRLRNLLNNAKNFPIQGLAAHIVNRAMIAVSREFRKAGLDAWVALQVHDEITCIAREDQAQLAADILKKCMEETTKITVPLSAEPKIADNWKDAK